MTSESGSEESDDEEVSAMTSRFCIGMAFRAGKVLDEVDFDWFVLVVRGLIARLDASAGVGCFLELSI
jgi:hypothetical protein